jgi:hypothetical protein
MSAQIDAMKAAKRREARFSVKKGVLVENPRLARDNTTFHIENRTELDYRLCLILLAVYIVVYMNVVFLVFWIIQLKLPQIECNLINNMTNPAEPAERTCLAGDLDATQLAVEQDSFNACVTDNLKKLKDQYDFLTLLRGLSSYTKLPAILFGYLAVNFCSKRGDLDLTKRSHFGRINMAVAQFGIWFVNSFGGDIKDTTTFVVLLTWLQRSWVRLAFVYLLFIFTTTTTIHRLMVIMLSMVWMWQDELWWWTSDYDEMRRWQHDNNELLWKNGIFVLVLSAAWVYEDLKDDEYDELVAAMSGMNVCETVWWVLPVLLPLLVLLVLWAKKVWRQRFQMAVFLAMAPFVANNTAGDSFSCDASPSFSGARASTTNLVNAWFDFYLRLPVSQELSLSFGWAGLGALLISLVFEKFYKGTIKEYFEVLQGNENVLEGNKKEKNDDDEDDDDEDEDKGIDLYFTMVQSAEHALPCCLAVVLVTEFCLAFYVHYSVPFQLYAALEKRFGKCIFMLVGAGGTPLERNPALSFKVSGLAACQLMQFHIHGTCTDLYLPLAALETLPPLGTHVPPQGASGRDLMGLPTRAVQGLLRLRGAALRPAGAR